MIAAHAPTARGLSNMWFVFLPPDVDTCLQAGACATNAFAGYHSPVRPRSWHHGLRPGSRSAGRDSRRPPAPILRATPRPSQRSTRWPTRPRRRSPTRSGRPGWIPTAWRPATSASSAPSRAPRSATRPTARPYNQVINGHQYLLQDMWSNAASGCVQASTATGSPLPLHTISLHQYSSVDQRKPRRGQTRPGVDQLDSRAWGRWPWPAPPPAPTARWGPVQLRDAHGTPTPSATTARPGDLLRLGAASPAPELIATGDGGNPFTQSGYHRLV